MFQITIMINYVGYNQSIRNISQCVPWLFKYLYNILYNPNISFQDKHGVPIVTAPIHMTATTLNHSKELMVGEWTPTKRLVHG